MWFHVVACDYDGTLAHAGSIAPETMAALHRLRDSGRRVVLVTGRQFADLLTVCPDLDVFDLVVAENGGTLYDPRSRAIDDLAEPPPPAFLTALEQGGVPFSTGRTVVSTVVPHEGAVLDAIRALGLELHIVFNKEAVMVLPAGVSKASGLDAALQRLGLSRHNAVGVGDAENDHAFLRRTGFAVAVANAVPALAEAADLVTRAPNGAGVRELVDALLANDLDEHAARELDRAIELGRADDGTSVTHPGRGPNVLVTGATGDGTSALAAIFVERLVREDWVVCLLDPAGTHRNLAEREGLAVLASEAGTEESRAQEVVRLLGHRSTSVAVDLSALSPAGRVRAAARFLRAVQRLRDETGAPHWVVVDHAHDLLPAGGGLTPETSGFVWSGVCVVTDEPGRVTPDVLRVARRVLSTSMQAATATLHLLGRDGVTGGEPKPGEALDVVLDESRKPQLRRFRIARGEGPRDDRASRGV
jgi:hydroxymethylpyrimidine pyrophosphatase-like HAD family hydrolase